MVIGALSSLKSGISAASLQGEHDEAPHRPKTFLLGLADPEVRAAFGSYVRDVVRHPARLFQPIYLQSVGIVQGPDMMPDGRADMCDSCPDMTVYDGQLINSCRMDEWRLYGGYLSS
jgi:hypothetical protein